MEQSHEARELDTLQFHELTVADVMERVVQSAHQRTKGDVLGSMMIEGFGGVPIVHEGHRLVRLVTEFDLLAAPSAWQQFFVALWGNFILAPAPFCDSRKRSHLRRSFSCHRSRGEPTAFLPCFCLVGSALPLLYL